MDVLHGDLYWSSPTGHAVFRCSYRRYNASYVESHPELPIYSLVQVGVATPALASHNNSGVETIVTGHGLTGDYGKDPAQSPLLIAAVMDDPDDGDSTFGNGDVIMISFDRPTNVSDLALSGNPAAIGFDKGTKMDYVDSLFTLSEPLGDEYSGEWLDASTFEITVINGWLPQPQINASAFYTTKVCAADEGRAMSTLPRLTLLTLLTMLTMLTLLTALTVLTMLTLAVLTTPRCGCTATLAYAASTDRMMRPSS